MPPMPTRSSASPSSVIPASVNAEETNLRSALSSAAAGGSDSRNRSLMRREPSCIDHARSSRRSRKRTSSTLPPPTSIVSPLVTGRSCTAPKKPSRASWSPSITWSGTPRCCARPTSSSPSAASRTAAVATAIMCAAPAPRATALKSRRASKVRSMASGPRVSESRRSRASRRGARASSMISRCSPSRRRKTIMRPELDPMSTTANGRSSGAGYSTALIDPCSHERVSAT